MKKILSLILAGLMTVSCAAFVAADDAAVEPAADPAQTYALNFLHTQGIWKGVDEGEFVADAESAVQRYQMALLVARVSTGWLDDAQWMDDKANDSAFDDIEEGVAANYLGALSYANQNGIIEGVSATKFAPYAGITYRDALTMVVRTLGYKDLLYPWGYIEKAVELGLTEGVDVAYTTELTRGEVAEILYAALFAATKTGPSLAETIFGYEFGYRNIVITASDRLGGFKNLGKVAPAGYVGFNIINEDGTVDAKTYFVKEAELGLENGHDAELAVGSVYVALFTVDGDLATLVDDCYDSAKVVETIYNNGITNNAGEAYATMPIADALAPYTVVKAHAGKEYITYMGEELFIYEQSLYTYKVAGTHSVAVDMTTGDLLEWNEAKAEFELAWKYNEILDKYYNTFYDEETNTIAMNWMSEKEFADWFAAAGKVDKTETQWKLREVDLAKVGANPYAKLDLYNLDNDYNVAEYATYKEYRIGIFSNGSKECGVNAAGVNHADGKKYPTYTITTLEGTDAKTAFVEAGHEAHDTGAAGFAWFNVADDVIGFVNEDGTYNDGVVVYNWNDTTGEIEVVKYIPEKAEGTDEDSYFVTGVLQAYSTANNYVTIDGERLSYGYDKLIGNTLNKKDKTVAQRAEIAAELDEYLMQYVKVLVVDGLVVDVDLVNAYGDNVIVVLGYAGVTSDGYIAVYGYSTFNTGVSLYKIDSYNGWKKGDYRYYPSNYEEDAAFEAGSIYTIKSYNADENCYGVYTENYIDAHDKATLSQITFEKGYRIIKTQKATGGWDDDTAVIAKAEAADKYIIVLDNGVIFVEDGVLDDHYSVAGDVYQLAGTKTFVVYVENNQALLRELHGFQNNGHEVGFVLYDGVNAANLEAAYDDAQVDEIYLLGSTATTVRVTNLLNGNVDTCIASNNITLEKGEVYVTLGNVIIGEYEDRVATGTAAVNFLTFINNVYAWNDAKYADYVVTNFFDMPETGLTDVEVALAVKVIDAPVSEVEKKIADATIKGIEAAFIYEYDTTGDLVLTKIANDLSTLKDGLYDGSFVYNPASGKYVLYIDKASIVENSSSIKVIDGAKGDEGLEIFEWLYNSDKFDDVESTLEADWAGTYAKVDGVASATIDTVALYFDTILAQHDDIAKGGYIFGMFDGHDVSHFGFNDSYIKVVTFDAEGDKVENFYRADEMGYYMYSDCDMVGLISLSNLGIKLTEGEKAYVRFVINGDTLGNDMAEGNNVEVVVMYQMVSGKVEVTVDTDAVINGKDVLTDALNEITISLIND